MKCWPGEIWLSHRLVCDCWFQCRGRDRWKGALWPKVTVVCRRVRFSASSREELSTTAATTTCGRRRRPWLLSSFSPQPPSLSATPTSSRPRQTIADQLNSSPSTTRISWLSFAKRSMWSPSSVSSSSSPPPLPSPHLTSPPFIHVLFSFHYWKGKMINLYYQREDSNIAMC